MNTMKETRIAAGSILGRQAGQSLDVPTMKPNHRVATCRVCGHVGLVDRSIPTSARLQCLSCGTLARVRQVVGDRPSRFHFPRRSHQEDRANRAREVIDRLDPGQLNDRLDDLWTREVNDEQRS
jgi:hypothetical protein